MSQKSSSSTSERNIYRVAHERRWTVHIKRNGRVWCKSFQDEQEGGESAALQAAKGWRDATCAEHPLMGQRARMQALTVKNTTGVPDVYHWNDGNGNPYWKAQHHWVPKPWRVSSPWLGTGTQEPLVWQ